MKHSQNDARLETLYEMAETDLATVLADPTWNRLRTRDPNFIIATAPSFRLKLLRHYFRQHRQNPWGRLERAHNYDLRWPMWRAPIWKLLKRVARHPADGDVIRSVRLPLERGWSVEFCATPAGGSFEHENGPVTARYGLDEVLVALFSRPAGDPRDVLGGWDLCLDLNGPDPIRYSGVEFFHHDRSVDGLFMDESEADGAAIASLARSRSGTYSRALRSSEQVRPLFAAQPAIADGRRYEGELRCRWKTVVYYPTAPVTDEGSVWLYERSRIDITGILRGAGIEDLQDVSWKYRRMRDLEGLIERQIASLKAHKVLAPIYNWVLFK